MNSNKLIAFVLTVTIVSLVFFLPVNYETKEKNSENKKSIKVMSKNFTMMNYKIMSEETESKEKEIKKSEFLDLKKNEDNIKIKNREQENNFEENTLSDNEKNENKEQESGQKTSFSSSINYQPDFTIDKIPVYPEAAKRMKQEGRVLITVVANSEGKILNVITSNSSGYPLLDEAAVKAVKEWRFSKLNLSEKINIIKTEIVFILRGK